ncbi:hypothetical protein LBR04_08480 [Levilactobacillus brevis]|nr:hypothetical protein L747_04785 [Levilactobacillus brevis BSO 464]GEB05658.1 hypothetical protein LBR03_05450 [Levilactobacillus brevis]GEB74109.1 hypothetical protein LBR04_08480 [Levilactobacillus brevis]
MVGYEEWISDAIPYKSEVSVLKKNRYSQSTENNDSFNSYLTLSD